MNIFEKEIDYPCTLTIIVKNGKAIIKCSRKKGNELFIDSYEIASITNNNSVNAQIKFIN